MTAPAAAPEQVYDAHYGRVVEVTPEQKAAEPKRFEAVGAQRVNMIGADGKSYSMPATSAASVMSDPEQAANWSWLGDADAARAAQVDFYRQQHGGAFKVGLHEAVNQATMGTLGVYEEHAFSPERLEAQRAENEAHRAAQVGGGALGLVANIGASGGFGVGGAARAAEGASAFEAAGLAGRAAGAAEGAQAARGALEAGAPGLLSRVAQATARGAAEGALYASPQAIAERAYDGDWNHAAETLLWGVGAGGLLGLGAGAFSEAVGAGKRALSGAATGALEKAGALEGGRLDLSKVGIASPERAAELRQAASAALEEHAGVLDKAIGDLPGARRAELGLGLKPSELAEKVSSTLAETSPGLTTRAASADAKAALAETVKKLSAEGSEAIGFGDLQKLRRSLLEDAVGSTERMRVARQVDQILETQQSKAMAQAYHALPLKADYASYLADLTAKQQAFGHAASLAAPSAAAQWAAKKASGAIGDVIGGGIGGAIGGAIGGPVGAWVGGKAAMGLANKLVDHVIGTKLLDASTGVLRKIANHVEGAPGIGAALAKDTVDTAARQIAAVPRLITQGTAQRVPDGFKAWLGPKANGLTKAQQFGAIASRLSSAIANPASVQHEAELAGSAFAFDPRLQAALAQKQMATIQYLHETMPKAPPPRPFAPVKWTPTPQQQASFGARLEVAHDPWTVLGHVSAGTLRAEHVETLRALYPGLHERMVAQVAALAHDPAAPSLSMGVRQQLSRLTGVSLDNSAGVNHQAVYAPVEPQRQTPPSKGHGGRGAKGGGNPITTSTQRLEYK